MIKRTNKLTALLITATSIASMTPAMAETKKAEESSGEIKNAVSFKDGKYVYEGSKSDKEYGVYYNDGKNEIKLDDIDNLDNWTKMGDNNLSVVNGSDEYDINMENGKVDKDDTRADASLKAKKTLRKKLAKKKKFGNDTKVVDFNDISNTKFGDQQWYSYVATGSKAHYDNVIDDGIVKICTTTDAAIDTTTDNGTTTDAAVDTSTDNNTTTSAAVDSNVTKAKSRITLVITSFYGDITIGGKKFTPTWGDNKPDMSVLASQIEDADFGSYTVESVEVYNDVLTATFTTNDELTEVPAGFTTGLDNTSGYGTTSVEKIVSGVNDSINNDSDEDADAKSEITLVITSFYGDITIAGKTFTPVWGDNKPDMETLASQISNTEFTGYKVKSAKAYNDVVVAIFTTDAEITEVPSDFTTGLDYAHSGYGTSTVKEVTAQNVTSTTTSAAVNTQTSSTANAQTSTTTNTKTSTAIITTTSINNEEDSNSDANSIFYYGYTDGNGNYIDCSKVANIKVFDGEKLVKVSKFNDKVVSGNKVIKVGLPTLEKTLGQDDKYIYNLISVIVTGYHPEIGGGSDDSKTILYYVQKISKVKNDKDNTPSKVESYQLNNNVGDEGDNADYTEACDLLTGDDSTKQIRIVNGYIYVAHEITDDDDNPEVEVVKMKLKSSGRITSDNSDKSIVEPIVAKDSANDTKMDSWTMDSDGNVWAIYSGKIKKSEQGDDFKDVYKVDGAIDRLDVYNDNNLIAWSSDSDQQLYVSIGEEAKQEAKQEEKQEDKAQNTEVKTGWNKLDNGTWNFYDATGKLAKGWANLGTCWYYFNKDGIMQTGWLNENGTWYYLDESGAMKTGWIKLNEKWYYLNKSGAMQQNTVVDGYVLDSNGVWIQ